MPIYEYVCNDCGTRYEQIVLSKTTDIACPQCSSRRRSLQLSVFSPPAKSSGPGAGGSGGFSGPCCGGACGCN